MCSESVYKTHSQDTACLSDIGPSDIIITTELKEAKLLQTGFEI